MTKRTKRYVYEVLAAVLGLLLLTWVVSLITPYTAPKQYSFIDSSQRQSTTVFRASVVSKHNDSFEVRLQDGPESGNLKTIPIENWTKKSPPEIGMQVLVTESDTKSGLAFYDQYRLPLLLMMIVLFVLVVLLVGRRKGLMSLAGLGAGIIIIGWGIVPLVINGYNSLLVSVGGAYIIAVVSLLIAHGFQRRTYISVACVLVVLVFVTVLAQVFVGALGLSGVVDDASFYLHSTYGSIDLSGIIVGGIVIAALGALDDVVSTQVATVDELIKINPSRGVLQVYSRAASVGGEHIAALVNTLALVYVGAALPLIVAYTVNASNPLLIMNGQFAATEIARTIIVSIGLVLSVPISTLCASYILTRRREAKQ